MAPYYCKACDKEVQKLLVIAQEGEHLGNVEALRAPPRKCPECGAPIEFDEVEEKYFHFIALQQKE